MALPLNTPLWKKELGYDTAFRATLKRGEGPKCSIMVEYDALPGIGHGCGHNLHGPLSVLAGIVLSELPEDAFHGTLEVIGTPAEETVGAKLIFAKEGVFDGDALAIMMHSTSGGIKTPAPQPQSPPPVPTNPPLQRTGATGGEDWGEGGERR